MQIKKILSLLLCAAMALCLCSACGGSPSAKDGGGGKLSVVAAIFPLYDWTRAILGDGTDAELTLLLDSGVDLHSFQPTVADVVTISTCDLFIYVGGESDEWVSNALAEAVNPDMAVIDLMDILGADAAEEEFVEGMELGGADDGAYDEHVWLSVRSARLFCEAIAEALEELDPDNAATYAANADAYCAELDALDADYAETIAAAPLDTVLFGDRFPFRYLTDDYGLRYYAAFAGCSAETEASFETIVFLAAKVDELGLPAVLTIEGSDRSVAETIVANTQTGGQAILTIDSLQSTTSADARAGKTYLGTMRENLTVLAQALGG